MAFDTALRARSERARYTADGDLIEVVETVEFTSRSYEPGGTFEVVAVEYMDEDLAFERRRDERELHQEDRT